MEDNPKRVSDVMTRDLAVLRPTQTLRDAAQKMADLNVGVW
jgi:hypothetical protein